MKRIITVVGARPQFIKMATVSRALKEYGIKEVVIHTGQHYDQLLSGIFFKELRIPTPRYELGVGSGPHGAQTARMLEGIEQVLLKEKPGLVMVYGDTNSTLAGALAAVKLGIPVAHVEAGLRSFNPAMPEEINRTATDVLAQILFCPTRTAVENLRREGRVRGVHLVGDVMYDSLKAVEKDIPLPQVARPYFLCTIHRAENTDSKDTLREIFRALAGLSHPIVMPLHPRTRERLARFGITPAGNIHISDPVSYSGMLSLEKHARCILTDSGGVQKEAFILGTPCVTLRRETEWQETLRGGHNILTRTDPECVTRAVRKALSRKRKTAAGSHYGSGNAHVRIARILSRWLHAH